MGFIFNGLRVHADWFDRDPMAVSSLVYGIPESSLQADPAKASIPSRKSKRKTL